MRETEMPRMITQKRSYMDVRNAVLAVLLVSSRLTYLEGTKAACDNHNGNGIKNFESVFLEREVRNLVFRYVIEMYVNLQETTRPNIIPQADRSYIKTPSGC
jgi:hypothetical protein